MPPNQKVVASQNYFRNHTLPFGSKGKNVGSVVEPSVSSGETNMLSLSERKRWLASKRGAARLQTKARYSYQLDRYEKNAMLIFHNGSSLSSDVTAVRETFERFGFEVDVHHNVTGDEAVETCNLFFRRDFTDYGCVAVVVISPANHDGSLAFQGRPLNDNDILKFLAKGWTPTLDSKPKLYITEASPCRKTLHLDIVRKPDLYELYLPNTQYRNPPLPNGDIACHALNALCHKLDRLWNEKNFVEIIYVMMEEDFSPLVGTDYVQCVPISLTSSFSKQLWFWQTS